MGPTAGKRWRQGVRFVRRALGAGKDPLSGRPFLTPRVPRFEPTVPPHPRRSSCSCRSRPMPASVVLAMSLCGAPLCADAVREDAAGPASGGAPASWGDRRAPPRPVRAGMTAGPRAAPCERVRDGFGVLQWERCDRSSGAHCFAGEGGGRAASAWRKGGLGGGRPHANRCAPDRASRCSHWTAPNPLRTRSRAGRGRGRTPTAPPAARRACAPRWGRLPPCPRTAGRSRATGGRSSTRTPSRGSAPGRQP